MAKAIGKQCEVCGEVMMKPAFKEISQFQALLVFSDLFGILNTGPKKEIQVLLFNFQMTSGL